MYLVVGLGNPEPEYRMTRHNMGFDVINKLSEKYDIKVDKKGFKSLYGTGIINNEKVILCKPQTFMNLSGEAVIEFVKFYKLKLENVIIVYDDIDLEPSSVRVRLKGSSGSHNGMKSIVSCLNSTEFPRVRIGTGKPEYKSDLVNYVIGKISKEEYSILEKGIETGAKAVEEILAKGINNAMNIINAIKE